MNYILTSTLKRLLFRLRFSTRAAVRLYTMDVYL